MKTSRVALRYAAFQLPGLSVAVLGCVLANAWFGVPAWVATVGVILWIAKDAALFPLVRSAYEPGDGRVPREVVDAIGTAQEDLDPSGYVRVGSELWRATCSPGESPIRQGAAIRVTASEGLTLHVTPHPTSETVSRPGGLG